MKVVIHTSNKIGAEHRGHDPIAEMEISDEVPRATAVSMAKQAATAMAWLMGHKEAMWYVPGEINWHYISPIPPVSESDDLIEIETFSLAKMSRQGLVVETVLTTSDFADRIAADVSEPEVMMIRRRHTLVDPALACPECGERVMDRLAVWAGTEAEIILCGTCGRKYEA